VCSCLPYSALTLCLLLKILTQNICDSLLKKEKKLKKLHPLPCRFFQPPSVDFSPHRPFRFLCRGGISVGRLLQSRVPPWTARCILLKFGHLQASPSTRTSLPPSPSPCCARRILARGAPFSVFHGERLLPLLGFRPCPRLHGVPASMLVPVELSLSLVPSLHAVVPPAPSCASSSARSNPSSSSRHLCFPPHPPASCKLPCPGGWCSPTSSDLHQARACLRSFIATSRRSARPGSIAPSPLAGARRPAPAPCSPLPMPRAPLVVRARSCELRLAAPPVLWSWRWCGVATSCASRQPSWPRSSPAIEFARL
jgi:hypothetical protein